MRLDVMPLYPVRLHLAVDVFEREPSKVDKVRLHPPGSGFVKRARDNDPTGRGFAFKSCGDIHSIPIEVASIYEQVAKMQANPEHDALLLRLVGIGLVNGLLELDGGPQGIHCAPELGQRPVACELHQAATVAGKGWFQALRPTFLQACEGTGFIPSHKPGITDDIGRQNGELTLFAHASPRTETSKLAIQPSGLGRP